VIKIVAPLRSTHKIRADVFLEPEINDRLKLYAEKYGVPRAKVIERAVKEFLENHKGEI